MLENLDNKLESMNESMVVMNEKMEFLKCSNPIGSFDNPADNCSHIKCEHPNSNSGIKCAYTATCIIQVRKNWV